MQPQTRLDSVDDHLHRDVVVVLPRDKEILSSPALFVIFCATVVLPEPDSPEIPIVRMCIVRPVYDKPVSHGKEKAFGLDFCV